MTGKSFTLVPRTTGADTRLLSHGDYLNLYQLLLRHLDGSPGGRILGEVFLKHRVHGVHLGDVPEIDMGIYDMSHFHPRQSKNVPNALQPIPHLLSHGCAGTGLTRSVERIPVHHPAV